MREGSAASVKVLPAKRTRISARKRCSEGASGSWRVTVYPHALPSLLPALLGCATLAVEPLARVPADSHSVAIICVVCKPVWRAPACSTSERSLKH